MKAIEVTDDQREFLAVLVKRAKEDFAKEKATILSDVSPTFLKGEALTEEFFKDLENALR